MKIFYDEEVGGGSIANINALWQNSSYATIDDKCIDNNRFPYIAGYKNAADIVVKESINNPLKDIYVYPIVFMYRQYLELLFKNIYLLYEQDKNKHRSFIKKVNHSLKDIFDECRPLIEKYYSDKNLDNCCSLLEFDSSMSHIYIENRNPQKLISIEEIEGFINDFNTIDSNSFNFRYDFEKSLEKTIKTPKSIDLKELYIMIERIDEVFFITYNGI